VPPLCYLTSTTNSTSATFCCAFITSTLGYGTSCLPAYNSPTSAYNKHMLLFLFGHCWACWWFVSRTEGGARALATNYYRQALQAQEAEHLNTLNGQPGSISGRNTVDAAAPHSPYMDQHNEKAFLVCNAHQRLIIYAGPHTETVELHARGRRAFLAGSTGNISYGLQTPNAPLNEQAAATASSYSTFSDI